MATTEGHKQVLFEGTARSFPTEAHIECRFVIQPTLSPTTHDWVGLFKVGWASIRDCIHYEYIQTAPGDTTNVYSILFMSSNLPQEDGEFYQFVYFDAKGHMRGASSPFTFNQPRCDDLIEEEMAEDDEMLFITTRQMQMESQLQKAQVERDELKQRVEVTDTDRNNLLEKLSDCQKKLSYEQNERVKLITQLETETQIRQELQAELEDVQNRCAQSEQHMEVLTQELSTFTVRNEELREALQKKEEMVNQLRSELDEQRGEIQALTQEKLQYVSHVTASELVKSEYQAEMEKLKSQLGQLEITEAQLVEAKGTIQELQEEKTECLETIAAMDVACTDHCQENSTLKETLESLSRKVEDTEAVLSSNKCLIKERHELLEEKEEWQRTIEEHSKEKNSLLSTIQSLQMKLDALTEEQSSAQNTEDRYLALQTAYSLLKDEWRDMKSKLDANRKREATLTESERQARKLVSDLQQKLKQGEQEWSLLATEKAKLERKLSKTRVSRPVGLGDTEGLMRRSYSVCSGSECDLSREELLKMVEQLHLELEDVKMKKDRYKQKYLDEKQRCATVRDYYTGELTKYQTERKLTLSVLDAQVGQAPLADLPPPTPIVYPSVKSAGAASPTGSGDKLPPPIIYPRLGTQQAHSADGLKGALEQSLIEDKNQPIREPMTPLPPPMQPSRLSSVASSHTDGDGESLELSRRDMVVSYREDPPDSDDDNDRDFHDASDAPIVPDEAPASCCVCHKQFTAEDSTDKRSEHINQHLDESHPFAADPANCPDSVFFNCPMCPRKFDKTLYTAEQFSQHVNHHFDDN